MSRLFELVVAWLGLVICVVPLFTLLCPLYCFYGGQPIFKSTRVGLAGLPFVIYKFRSMRLDAPLATTEDLVSADSFVLPFGGLLRRYSIDELPQLINIIKGDMNLVGPRPALLADKSLIKLRESLGVDLMRPGITGLAQVNGRDSLSMEEKVKFEVMYSKNQSPSVYFAILLKSFKVCFSGSNISH
jgi:O-antigen biosynthesis protein WbqP